MEPIPKNQALELHQGYSSTVDGEIVRIKRDATSRTILFYVMSFVMMASFPLATYYLGWFSPTVWQVLSTAIVLGVGYDVWKYLFRDPRTSFINSMIAWFVEEPLLSCPHCETKIELLKKWEDLGTRAQH